jgi:hypothetical protein
MPTSQSPLQMPSSLTSSSAASIDVSDALRWGRQNPIVGHRSMAALNWQRKGYFIRSGVIRDTKKNGFRNFWISRTMGPTAQGYSVLAESQVGRAGLEPATGGL